MEDWARSREWFRKAQAAAGFAGTDEIRAMSVGLGADAAVASIEAEDIGGGLLALVHALEAVDDVDPDATLRGAYCHHIIRHAALWTNARVTHRDVRVAGQPVWLEAGGCSNPEPAAAIRERPLGHIDLAWYLLAEAEIAAGIDVGVQGRLDARLGEDRIPGLDLRLRLEAMQRSIRSADPEAFAKGLRAYVEAAGYVSKERGRLTDAWSGLVPTRGKIPKLDDGRLLADDAERAASGRDRGICCAGCHRRSRGGGGRLGVCAAGRTGAALSGCLRLLGMERSDRSTRWAGSGGDRDGAGVGERRLCGAASVLDGERAILGVERRKQVL